MWQTIEVATTFLRFFYWPLISTFITISFYSNLDCPKSVVLSSNQWTVTLSCQTLSNILINFHLNLFCLTKNISIRNCSLKWVHHIQAGSILKYIPCDWKYYQIENQNFRVCDSSSDFLSSSECHTFSWILCLRIKYI